MGAAGLPLSAVGYGKPPISGRWKPGQSGNPSGRPKNPSCFGDAVMKELFKTVTANVGGKIVKASNHQLFAQQMIKDGITKGTAAKKLVLQFMEQHEAREAAKEALKAKKQAEGSADIDWDAEQEAVYQEVMAKLSAVKR
jgi:Family of unknown function (DUF5681)